MTQCMPQSPEKDVVTLTVGAPGDDSNVVILDKFIEYSFKQDFLTPVDSFSFTLDGDFYDDPKVSEIVRESSRVELFLNGATQLNGYIDGITRSASISGGSVVRLTGRDALAQAADGTIDPTLRFLEKDTLETALKKVLGPYGFNNFEVDASADRSLRSNSVRAKRKASDGKGSSRRAVKAYKLHQTRPYPNEGSLEFLLRLVQRFGLWLWLSADGKTVNVDIPDFESDPINDIVRVASEGSAITNVLEGEVASDVSKQPTAIIADSYAKEGEFGPGRVKTIFINTLVEVTDPNPPPYQKYKDAGATVIEHPSIRPTARPPKVPRHRVLYTHDDESVNQDQLESFIMHQMALFQKESLRANYRVEGHAQITPKGVVNWTVGTNVNVFDDVTKTYEVLFLLSKQCTKSRAGTFTHLEFIRKYTLSFTDPKKQG